MLIRRLLREAAEVGIGRVSLSVERANPARRLYEREGFRVLEDLGDLGDLDAREGEGSVTMITSLR